MGFSNSLPVPESSKVIPAHPCFNSPNLAILEKKWSFFVSVKLIPHIVRKFLFSHWSAGAQAVAGLRNQIDSSLLPHSSSFVNVYMNTSEDGANTENWMLIEIFLLQYGSMAILCTMLVLVILRATMMMVLVVLSYFECNSSGDGGDLVKWVVRV